MKRVFLCLITVVINCAIYFAQNPPLGYVYPKDPINSSLKTDTLRGLDGSGYLRGTYANVLNSEQKLNGQFFYTPDNIHFDEVNAYYHVDLYARHLAVLGFPRPGQPGLGQVLVQCHAGVAASPGSWSGGKISLNYGGILYQAFNGVPIPNGLILNDPAKENDLIYHEYQHGVNDYIGLDPYKTRGEASALAEAFCDYFAASFADDPHYGRFMYSRASSTEDARNVDNNSNYFNYSNYDSVQYALAVDAKGELVRTTLINPPVYINSFTDNHANGMIWSGLLWDIRRQLKNQFGQLGVNITDKLALNALYIKNGNATFFEEGQALIQADMEMYNGAHVAIIQNCLAQRGIIGFKGTVYKNMSWSGTMVIIGTVTVNNGATLTINPGTTVKFTSGASLICNGRLIANNATFTSTGSTSPGAWGSIRFSGSGASSSSMTGCTIQYGTQIDVLNNANNVSISSCSILNSSGHGINVSSTSGFTASYNIIANNNVNNGINGIIISSSTNCICLSNTIYKTGSAGYGHGVAIQFNSSAGTIRWNDINHYGCGIGASNGSNINSTIWGGRDHNNRITNCQRGVWIYQSSRCDLGQKVNGIDNGHGNNSIYGNSFNAEVGNNFNDPSTLYASDNWWGANPPSGFTVWPSSAIFVYSFWQTSDPWRFYSPSPEKILDPNSSETSKNKSIASINSLISQIHSSSTEGNVQYALPGEKFTGNNKAAVEYLKSYINDHSDDYTGYLIMYSAADSATIPDIINFFKLSKPNAPAIHKLLLANLYLLAGKPDLAEKENNNLIMKVPNTALAVAAMVNNMRIELYTKNNIQAAKAIFDQVEKLANMIDPMELADAMNMLQTYVPGQTPYSEGQNNDEANQSPVEFSLGNYPNPFNPSTTISFSIKDEGNVKLAVYDCLGREVVKLIDGYQTKGKHEIKFNGNSLASGLYFYRLTAGNYIATRKMLLLK